MDEINELVFKEEANEAVKEEENGVNEETVSFKEEPKEPLNDALNIKSEEKNEDKILKKKEISGTEIASFVLAASSLVFLAGIPFLGMIFALVCAILSICLGAPYKKEKNPLASAAFIISVVAIVLSVLSAIISLFLGNALLNAVVYFLNQNSSPFGFGSPFYMFP